MLRNSTLSLSVRRLAALFLIPALLQETAWILSQAPSSKSASENSAGLTTQALAQVDSWFGPMISKIGTVAARRQLPSVAMVPDPALMATLEKIHELFSSNHVEAKQQLEHLLFGIVPEKEMIYFVPVIDSILKELSRELDGGKVFNSDQIANIVMTAGNRTFMARDEGRDVFKKAHPQVLVYDSRAKPRPTWVWKNDVAAREHLGELYTVWILEALDAVGEALLASSTPLTDDIVRLILSQTIQRLHEEHNRRALKNRDLPIATGKSKRTYLPAASVGANYQLKLDPLAKQEYTRKLTRNVFALMMQKLFERYLQRDDTILEIGAGPIHTFQNLVRHVLPVGSRWLDSDRMEMRPGQMIAGLPHLAEIPDNSMDAVVGLSVMDVIPEQDLPASLAGIARILKPGRAILQILDLDLYQEITARDATFRGQMPIIIETHDRPDRPILRKIAFIDRGQLSLHMSSLSTELSGELISQLQRLLKERNAFLRDDHVSWNHLRAILEEQGVRVSEEVDFTSYSVKRLVRAVDQANAQFGTHLVVEECGARTAEAFVPEKELLGLPPGVKAITHSYGSVEMWKVDPFGDSIPNKVRIRSSPIVLVIHNAKPPIKNHRKGHKGEDSAA